MAQVQVSEGVLTVVLAAREKLAMRRSDLCVPLRAITRATAVPDTLAALGDQVRINGTVAAGMFSYGIFAPEKRERSAVYPATFAIANHQAGIVLSLNHKMFTQAIISIGSLRDAKALVNTIVAACPDLPGEEQE